LKGSLISTEVPALYDPNLDTIASADASAYFLGAVNKQMEISGQWLTFQELLLQQK